MNRRKDSKGRILKENENERSNGTYEFKWRTKTGKRHSIYAKTLEELREQEKEIAVNIIEGIEKKNSTLTVNDIFKTWENLKRGLKQNTFQNYIYMYNMFVKPDFGNILIRDLKKSDVRAFYNRLYDHQHLKVSTIDNIHTVLHQVLQIAVDDECLRSNPADNALKELRAVHPRDSIKKQSLTIEEQHIFEDFLDRDDNEQWKTIFKSMLWTGLRVGEMVGLRWEDVDLENGIIYVNHTLIYAKDGTGKLQRYSNTPKTEAGIRTVPILPVVKEAFLEEKKRQKRKGIFCNSNIQGYTDFVFLNRHGFAYSPSTLNKALYRIQRDCNFELIDKAKGNAVVLLPHFSNHTLRHTFVTRLCESGVPVKAIQSIVGHRDIRTTLDVYADATEQYKKEELFKFDYKMEELIREKFK